jgi:hypothetical protein
VYRNNFLGVEVVESEVKIKGGMCSLRGRGLWMRKKHIPSFF